MKKNIHSDRHKKLRALLVKERQRANLTQAALAKKLGRPQSFVAKYEGGERRLDLIELIDLAKVLGADVRAIVDKLS